MQTIQNGSKDEWSFEVDCRFCGSTQIVEEKKLFTLNIKDIPMPIPSFVCRSCGQTCPLTSGDMPIHVYYRLPHGSPTTD